VTIRLEREPIQVALSLGMRTYRNEDEPEQQDQTYQTTCNPTDNGTNIRCAATSSTATG
jgi:hypothetical protein